MWSHYGNGHRGVAIEFDTTALAKSLDKDEYDSPWWKMNYIKEVPKIKWEDIFDFVINAPHSDLNRSKLSSVVTERLSSKGEIWENEDEWRLALENDETRLKILRHDIPNSAVTAVYLGCRAAEQEKLRNDFIHETQRNFPNATVFRAKMRHGEFALDFDKIS